MNDAQTPFPEVVRAEGYVRVTPREVAYVGHDQNVAERTIPNPLPADGLAVLVKHGDRWAVTRYLPHEAADPVAEAEAAVQAGGDLALLCHVVKIGGLKDDPHTLLRAHGAVRRVDDVDRMLAAQDAFGHALGQHTLIYKASLDPTNPSHFERIVMALLSMILKVSGRVEAEHLREWVDGLKFDWAKATDTQLLQASRNLNGALRKVSGDAWQGIRGRVSVVSEKTAKDTRRAVIKEHDFSINSKLAQPDIGAIRRSVATNGHYIRNQYMTYEPRLSAKMRDVVNDGMKRGLGSDAIARRVEAQLGSQLGQLSRSYYHGVAHAVNGRSRAYSNLVSFRDAGIEKYVIESILDEVTTERCRFLHGKTLIVGHALDRYAATDALADPTEVNFEQPWLQEKLITSGDDKGKMGIYIPGREGMTRAAVIEGPGRYSKAMGADTLMAHNVGSPPYHWKCRTSLVPAVGGI